MNNYGSDSNREEPIDIIYRDNHTKEMFVRDVLEMVGDNFYVHIILVSLLKMQELDILSVEEVDRLFEQVMSHSEKLKEDFEKAREMAEHGK